MFIIYVFNIMVSKNKKHQRHPEQKGEQSVRLSVISLSRTGHGRQNYVDEPRAEALWRVEKQTSVSANLCQAAACRAAVQIHAVWRLCSRFF